MIVGLANTKTPGKCMYEFQHGSRIYFESTTSASFFGFTGGASFLLSYRVSGSMAPNRFTTLPRICDVVRLC